jgi:hypothetical protein
MPASVSLDAPAVIDAEAALSLLEAELGIA